MDAKTVNALSKLNKTAKLFSLLAAFAVILCAVYFLDTNDQLDQLVEAQNKEDTLKAEFLDKKKQAVNLVAYKQQLKEIETSFGTLLKQLPNKSEMDALLNDINQVGVGHGLQFELFRPTLKENIFGFYAEQPVSLRVIGTFREFGLFAEDISKLSRIVNLEDLNVSILSATGAKGSGDTLLALDAVAKTYRYLDDAEIAANRKQGAK